MTTCSSCHRQIAQSSPACQYCGFVKPPSASSPVQSRPPKNSPSDQRSLTSWLIAFFALGLLLFIGYHEGVRKVGYVGYQKEDLKQGGLPVTPALVTPPPQPATLPAASEETSSALLDQQLSTSQPSQESIAVSPVPPVENPQDQTPIRTHEVPLIKSPVVQADNPPAPDTIAEEHPPLTIAMIFEEPRKHIARDAISVRQYVDPLVSLEGTVQDLKLQRDVYLNGQKSCRQEFKLADGTGTIAAYYDLYGNCDDFGPNKGLILASGDRIAVTASLIYGGVDSHNNPLHLHLVVRNLTWK